MLETTALITGASVVLVDVLSFSIHVFLPVCDMLVELSLSVLSHIYSIHDYHEGCASYLCCTFEPTCSVAPRRTRLRIDKHRLIILFGGFHFPLSSRFMLYIFCFLEHFVIISSEDYLRA